MKTRKRIVLYAILLATFYIANAQELTNNIYFSPGKITIDKRSYDELYDIADIMQALPDYDFLVAGHVDSASTPENGVKISKMRADAVKTFLIKAGVKPNQIETIGYGFSKLKFNNQTPFGRKKNRRVEISLKGSEEAVEIDEVVEDVDADFNLAEIAKQYNIPLKLLREWNKIQGKLSFLEGEKDQLNKNIHFRSGSIIVRSSSKKLLELIADFMMKYPETNFTIGGHTDSLGSIEYNKEVSQGRANACVDYFRKAGVKKERLKTIAHGFTRPKFMNKNTWGKAQLNRRVEIVFDALNDYNIERDKKIEEAQSNAFEVGKAINNLTIPGMKKIYHKILKKQTLYAISQMYDIKIKDIRKWNGVRGNTIYTGQRIVIFVKE
ncbi:MAG: OmpA family protein [Flavobacteriaceae bacterium]|nr:OmpA family protein [Flavobacteriaceae bacterium]